MLKRKPIADLLQLTWPSIYYCMAMERLINCQAARIACHPALARIILKGENLKRMLVALAALAFTNLAFAVQFPVKPIRMITPYPPGGGTDAVARPEAAAFNKVEGQPVIVDN